jgi:hypothetical protein
MDKTALIQLIQRLRRDFPRHRDIIALCTACEALALAKPKPVTTAKPKFDRKAYQREYMRKWRKAKGTQLFRK